MRSLALCGVAWCAALAHAQFADPQACAACHRQIAGSYARTGMARSFGSITARDAIVKIAGPLFQHEASEEFFSVRQGEGSTFLTRHQVGVQGTQINFLEMQAVYRIGSGDHAQSYLARNRSGDLVELPVTWYSESGGHWGMSPGYDRPDHAGFGRKVTYRCMFCHNAYPANRAVSGDDSAAKFPVRLPQGIDCQRCHGPGESHVQAARRGLPVDAVRRAIVNPARLDAMRQMEVCLQCHLETTNLRLPPSIVRYGRSVFSYQPGEPLANYILHFDHAPGTGYDDKFEFSSAPYRLRKSACFVASRGALTCTSCHNPHDIQKGQDPRESYSRTCRRCHGNAIEERIGRGVHPPAQECVSCHMPRRNPSDAIHVTVTDHLIRKRPDAGSPAELVERHDGNTRPYRGPVVLYYPESLPATAENQLYLSLAQVRNQANLTEGIARLETAIRRSLQSHGEFNLDLAEAYRNDGMLEKAIHAYQEASLRSPADWHAFYGLGISLAAAGNPAGSLRALRQAVALGPRETAPLMALARTLLEQQNLTDALAALKQAKDLEPDSAEVHSQLGMAWLRAGNAVAAEDEVREALRLRPEAAAIHVNLAGLLSRRKNAAEAGFHFERAIRLDPNLAEARSAYATALASQGRTTEARAQYEAALRIDPRLWITHNNLGVLLFRQGDREDAMREYRLALSARPDYAAAHFNLAVALANAGKLDEAVSSLDSAIRYAPDYFEAHLELGQILIRLGETSRAVPHLRKAAQSPDSQVRQAALGALQ